MSPSDDAPAATPPFDAYAALGLDAAERASIDAARVKSAYRRMALATHPDKNDGDSRAFKRVAMAYKILGDAERRAAYDASGGVEGEDARDALETEIDISEVGFANTLVASVISSLGVNIKTAVPVKALEAVRRGETTGGVVDATMGCKLSESARKGEIRLFRCALSEEDVRRGVVVSATSPSGDKFKLLKFDRASNGDGGLELSLQEVSAKFDSVKPKRSHAGFYFTGHKSYNYEPFELIKMSKLESRDLAMFHALDNWTPRECVSISPGEHVFGVYGDNFFDKCKFEFEIFVVGTKTSDGAVLEPSKIREIETKMSKKRDDLMRFEKEYLAAKSAFEKVVVRHQQEADEVKALIAAREAAYCALTLPSVTVKEAEEPSGGASSSGFAMPTIDTSALKNAFNSFSNPFTSKK